MTTTIRDLIMELLDNRSSCKFQITATMTQFNKIKEDMRQQYMNSGLVISHDQLLFEKFSSISYEGLTINFIEGDHFSIKEIV